MNRTEKKNERARETAWANKPSPGSAELHKGWFLITLLYLVIDYGRPQEFLPIGFLRPSLLCVSALTLCLVANSVWGQLRSKQVTLILLFEGLLIVLIPVARNNMAAFQTAQLMLVYLPFIFSTIVCVDSLQRMRTMINLLILLMIHQGVYSIFHGGKGAGSYFADENDLSLFVNMWLPLCYFLCLEEKRPLHRAFYGLGLVVAVGSIAVSFSRGGFVGLIAVGFVAWSFSSKKVLSTVLLVFVGLLFYWSTGEEYWREMSTMTDSEDQTVNERILSWKAAWAMFLDNPWGVGGNNFQKQFPRYQSKELKRGMWNRPAHSVWFTLIPELGVGGIVVYLLLLWYNLKDVFRIRKRNHACSGAEGRFVSALTAGFLGSMAGYFASGSFLSVLYYSHYWYLTGIIVATRKILEREMDFTGGVAGSKYGGEPLQNTINRKERYLTKPP